MGLSLDQAHLPRADISFQNYIIATLGNHRLRELTTRTALVESKEHDGACSPKHRCLPRFSHSFRRVHRASWSTLMPPLEAYRPQGYKLLSKILTVCCSHSSTTPFFSLSSQKLLRFSLWPPENHRRHVCARKIFGLCVWVHILSVESNSLRPYGLSSPGYSVHGILQARILEWVAISFSRGSSRHRGRTHISCISYIGTTVSPVLTWYIKSTPPGLPVSFFLLPWLCVFLHLSTHSIDPPPHTHGGLSNFQVTFILPFSLP